MSKLEFKFKDPDGVEQTSKYNLQTNSGIKFSISCKELNDAAIQNKLKECFKILSK